MKPNVVGYQEQASRAGFNYMTPTFVKVGGGLLTAQDLQMQEGLAVNDANIQVLDDRGIAPKGYLWYPKSYFDVDMAGKALYTDENYTIPFVFPEGAKGIWAYETYNKAKKVADRKWWYEILDKELAPADAVQVYTKDADTKMTTSGEVPNENTLFTSIAGFNYVGNPYPVAISTKDIQMQDGLAVNDANIQVLDDRGIAPKGYLWYPKSYFDVDMAGKALYTDENYTIPFVFPEGAKGIWAYETYNKAKKVADRKWWYEVLDKELKPGEGIQVYTKDAETDITVLCPYDL